jgi:hypothetical protein
MKKPQHKSWKTRRALKQKRHDAAIKAAATKRAAQKVETASKRRSDNERRHNAIFS